MCPEKRVGHHVKLILSIGNQTCLKGGIVEPKETSITWQRFSKQVPATKNTQAIIEEHWERCFLLAPPRGYIMTTLGQLRKWKI
jgi:hypothetical protein